MKPCLQLNLVDEVRATTEQRLAWYQDLMAKHYNSKVRHRDFQVIDLVLRKMTSATRDPSQRKLGPNWKGPYRITSWQKKDTYHLETLDGQKLYHPRNTEHPRNTTSRRKHVEHHSSFLIYFFSFNFYFLSPNGRLLLF